MHFPWQPQGGAAELVVTSWFENGRGSGAISSLSQSKGLFKVREIA